MRIVSLAIFLCLVSGTLSEGGQVAFNKLDYFESVEGKEKKRDARLILDSNERAAIIAEEKKGNPVYVTVPYEKITKIVYERSAHRRYKSGVLLTPWLLLTKGKKHWLTIEFENIEEYPLGYVYARMDKKNYRRILAALEAVVGIEIEEVIEK